MDISTPESLETSPHFLRQVRQLPAVFAGKRRLPFVAAAVLMTLVGFFIASHKPAAAERAGEPVPALTVTTAMPSRVTWSATLEASGAIAPWQEAIIGSQVGGFRLAEVSVNVGDGVKRGQVLARFDADLIRADEAQLRAGIAQAEALAAQRDADLKRAQMLKNAGNLSEQDFLKSQTETATARTQVDSARAFLAAKELQLRYTDVVAPDDGTISARIATLGAVVPIGQELFRMIIRNRLEWRGELTASQLAQIAPGQTIELMLPDGTASSATVRATAPALDAQTRMGIVYADVEPGGHTRAGMYANGRIIVSQESALVVPASSVVIRDGYSYVLKLQGGGDTPKVKLQAVTVGRRQGAQIEILENLSEGEAVVVQGAGFLNDGDIVRVVKPEKAGKEDR